MWDMYRGIMTIVWGISCAMVYSIIIGYFSFTLFNESFIIYSIFEAVVPVVIVGNMTEYCESPPIDVYGIINQYCKVPSNKHFIILIDLIQYEEIMRWVTYTSMLLSVWMFYIVFDMMISVKSTSRRFKLFLVLCAFPMLICELHYAGLLVEYIDID
uniref:Uncharacterized protein n=1 Tax=viral metagenome TaxID=1070528 RepID=A0A6C0EXT3_9ZZZZ